MIPSLERCKAPIRPMGYNVLVAVEVVEEKTAGGIIIPDKHRERENAASDRGRIVAVAPMAFKGGDWADEPNPPQAGDVVIFQRYAGKEIELSDSNDGVKYRVVPDADIKGVFN